MKIAQAYYQAAVAGTISHRVRTLGYLNKSTWFGCDCCAERKETDNFQISVPPLLFRVRSTGHLNLLPTYFDHPENKRTVHGFSRPSFILRACKGRKRSIGQLRIESKAVLSSAVRRVASRRRVPRPSPRSPISRTSPSLIVRFSYRLIYYDLARRTSIEQLSTTGSNDRPRRHRRYFGRFLISFDKDFAYLWNVESATRDTYLVQMRTYIYHERNVDRFYFKISFRLTILRRNL